MLVLDRLRKGCKMPSFRMPVKGSAGNPQKGCVNCGDGQMKGLQRAPLLAKKVPLKSFAHAGYETDMRCSERPQQPIRL
jgi:hypothetical protein